MQHQHPTKQITCHTRHHKNKHGKDFKTTQIVRQVYNQIFKKDASCYPEQLDVTFFIAQRMCEEKRCDLCVFGGGIKGLCHGQINLFCPVALLSCGFKHICKPDKCGLKDDSFKDLCGVYLKG